MLRFLSSLLLALSGLAFPLHASEPEDSVIRIEFQAPLDGEAHPATPATVRLQTVVGAGGIERTSQITLPGTYSLAVPTAGETFQLHLESDHYWSPDRLISQDDLDSTLILPLRPLGSLSGSLETVDGQPVPLEISLRFQPTRAPTCARCKTPPEIHGEVSCSVEGLEWRCRVPTGAFDLRLEATGFIPHYWADTLVTPAEDLPLGHLLLAKGASLVGRVEGPGGAPVEGATVLVVPDLGDQPLHPATESLRMVRHSALSDARGFFQVTGLEPGTALVKARKKGIQSSLLRASLQPRQELQLRDALVVTPPIDVQFRLNPPQDPAQAPWSLRLIAKHPPINRSGRVDGEGQWTARALEPAEYSLMILDSRGARFHFETLVVDRTFGPQIIELALVAVEGNITLGGEPVSATVFFGGRSGQTSIALEADTEGHFSGFLPRAGAWTVDVAAKEPALYRRLAAVEVPVAQGATPSQVDIELPDTTLSGDVLDEAGRPADGATVLIAPVDQKEKLSPIRTQSDGSFEARGFEPGRFRLEAHDLSGKPRRSSAPVEVEIKKGLDPPPIRLVLRTGLQIEGVVQALGGEGIAGAGILALPLRASATEPTLVPHTQSGPDGYFFLTVPAGTQALDLTVMAPGFLFHRQQFPIEPKQPIRLQLPQDGGGDLHIEHVPLAQAGRAYLLRDGQRWDLTTLLRWAEINRVTHSSDALRIPRMPPGAYRLCTVDDDLCAKGWLPNHGTLTLNLQGADEGPSRAE
jgi:hypothetical protein